MEDDVIETAIIDPNYGSYEQFFDHGWCRRMFSAVEHSPLKTAVATLLIAWRLANGSHRLPWLMVHVLKSFAEGGVDGDLRFRAEYFEAVIKGLVEKLEAGMNGTLKPYQRVALNRVVKKIEKEAHQAVKAAKSKVQFDVPGYWASLVETSEFRFSILGSQSSNYGALFFAYEDFLANTIRTKDEDYNSKTRRIQDAFAEHFGEALTDYCWPNDKAVDEIDLARRIRHTFAHNGGRYRADLDRYKPRFVHHGEPNGIELRGERFIVSKGGKIQLTPGNTAYLFSVLKDRVSKIVEELA